MKPAQTPAHPKPTKTVATHDDDDNDDDDSGNENDNGDAVGAQSEKVTEVKFAGIFFR